MKGLIIECLRCLGIFPVSREVSIISLKSGVSTVDSFFVRDSGRGSICGDVCVYVCICVCMYVYVYICMYVCMHVCMYV